MRKLLEECFISFEFLGNQFIFEVDYHRYIFFKMKIAGFVIKFDEESFDEQFSIYCLPFPSSSSSKKVEVNSHEDIPF